MVQQKSPRKDYYAKWYQENRERISRKRKDAYDDDPEYKRKVLAQSTSHREKHRKAPRVKVPRHTVPRIHKAGDGGKITLYSIGFFSIFVGRSVQSINDWEKRGHLPRTPYVGPPRAKGQGFRYYTESMMVVVKEVIGDKRRLFPVAPDMSERISAAWAESGAPMDKSYSNLQKALKATKTRGVRIFALKDDYEDYGGGVFLYGRCEARDEDEGHEQEHAEVDVEVDVDGCGDEERGEGDVDVEEEQIAV